jgi:hypothetical protein
MSRITSSRHYSSVYVKAATVASCLSTLIVITGAGRKFG